MLPHLLLLVDWQTAAALVVVIGALAYIGYLGRRALAGGKSGCGTCGNCSTSAAPPSTLVRLDVPSPPSARRPQQSVR